MRISKEFTLEASHILPKHPGKCAKLHGHSWTVRLTIIGEVDKETGFVQDYAELSRMMGPIIERFDHTHLNCFIRYPSAENIATHIAWLIKPKLNHSQFIVEVSETRKTWAVWDSDNREDIRRINLHTDDNGWRPPEYDVPVLEGPTEELKKRYTALQNELGAIAKQELTVGLRTLMEYEQYRMYVDNLVLEPEIPRRKDENHA